MARVGGGVPPQWGGQRRRMEAGFSLWTAGHRLVANEAYRDGTGLGVAGRPSLGDYADQVYAVTEHVGVSACLVGFSWGGATALRVADAAPALVNSLTLIAGAGHSFGAPTAGRGRNVWPIASYRQRRLVVEPDVADPAAAEHLKAFESEEALDRTGTRGRGLTDLKISEGT